MSRLPFDPDRAPGAGEDDAEQTARRERTFERATDANELTVAQVVNLIKATLEQRIDSPLRVIGQVSNLNRPGHWYFTLKDEEAVLHCVAWASSAARFGITPQDGDEVVATGHVSHYPPQGRTQFYVTDLRPVGAGALELRFREMCAELRGLGYFDDARKRPLPAVPRKIAVVTSADGAALQDVIATAAQRCAAVGLVVVPVRVQGASAAAEIARAMRWVDANAERLGVDAMLVTRGGGSMEDLWAFNERVVADAAYASRLPVVAAIGHESDTTVIELVADVRAATPTQAAMRLVPAREELARQLDHLNDRLAFVLRRRMDDAEARLRAVERSAVMRDPAATVVRALEALSKLAQAAGRVVRERIAREQARLEQLGGRLARLQPAAMTADRGARLAVLADRLDRSLAQRIRSAAERLDALARQADAVDPVRVLERGFTYTKDARGRVIRSAHGVRGGSGLTTVFHDGEVHSTVGQRPRRAAADGEDQMDLFQPGQ